MDDVIIAFVSQDLLQKVKHNNLLEGLGYDISKGASKQGWLRKVWRGHLKIPFHVTEINSQSKKSLRM